MKPDTLFMTYLIRIRDNIGPQILLFIIQLLALKHLSFLVISTQPESPFRMTNHLFERLLGQLKEFFQKKVERERRKKDMS